MNKTISTAQKEQIAALRTKWEIQAKKHAKNEIETTIRFHESATRKPLDKAEKQRLTFILGKLTVMTLLTLGAMKPKSAFVAPSKRKSIACLTR